MTLYVLGFAFGKRKGRLAVLLVKKTSPPWQAGKYNGVGGRIEEGELPLNAMVREMAEETGINTSGDDWQECLTLRGLDETVRVFKMEHDNLYLAREMTVKDKPLVCEVDALPSEVVFNLRWIVPFLMDPQDKFGDVFYTNFAG